MASDPQLEDAVYLYRYLLPLFVRGTISISGEMLKELAAEFEVGYAVDVTFDKVEINVRRK